MKVSASPEEGEDRRQDETEERRVEIREPDQDQNSVAPRLLIRRAPRPRQEVV